MSYRKIIYDTGSLAIVFGLLAVAFGIDARAGKPARQLSVSKTSPEHYHVVHGWPLLPGNTILDEVSAVGVDSQDNVLVLQRGGRKWPDSDVLDQAPIAVPTVFLFDGRTGRLLAKWGEKLFALPHSLTVDLKDNIWVADVAWHQVFKFSHDGRLLLTLGERGKPGDDSSHFNRPTDVAVAPDGSFYVSDGYGNSRVLKFAADGKFLFQWGTKGKEPGQFDLPHGIALDAAGRVFVVDRQNARVQVFDSTGRYLRQWKGPHFVSPQDIKIGSDGTAFVAEGGNDKPPDRTGILVLRPDGSLVERIGRYGNYDGQFQDPHWLAVGKGGQVYVADFTGRRVQKFVRGKSGR
jgi:peptidylamidoglycolate lyase